MKRICKKEYAALNKLIYKYDFGHLYRDALGSKCFSRPTTEKWLKVLLARAYEKHTFYRPLNNRNLQAHENNEATYYYTPALTGRGLYGIDIDCLKSGGLGDKAGALAARSYIESLIGCYTEVSTSGLGGHGYVVVEYGNWTAEEVKDIWIDFCDALDRKCQYLKINIEKIEPKGLPVTIVVENRRLIPEKCKMGVLIKLPRNIKEAVKTCVMTPEQIVELTRKLNDSMPATEKVKVNPCCSNLFGNPKKIDKYRPFAKKVFYTYDNYKKSYDGRKATYEDLAIAFYILKFCKLKPNTGDYEGQLPTARIRKIWEIMYKEGSIERQYDARRWKILRNMLSDYCYIDWEDAEYCEDQAMKWEITDQLSEELRNKERKSITIGEVTYSLPPIIVGKRPINCWIKNYPEQSRYEIQKEVLKFIGNAA